MKCSDFQNQTKEEVTRNFRNLKFLKRIGTIEMTSFCAQKHNKTQSSRRRKTNLKLTIYSKNIHYLALPDRPMKLALTEVTTISFFLVASLDITKAL